MGGNYISFEHGEVFLDNVRVPGILVDLQVSGGMRLDSGNQDNMSGTVKIFMGWDDADISITMDLLCGMEEKQGKMVESTCYDKLAEINKLFKKADKNACPIIYSLTNSHTAALKIHNILFSSLSSYETDQDDVIQVRLGFTEYLPAVIKREEQANASKKTTGQSGTPSVKPPKATPAASPAILKDDDSALVAGIKAGMR